jgi:predicted ester cyclase
MVAQGILDAFPDVVITIDLIIAEGNLVATRHTIVATHQGTFNGIPATQNAVTWTENHIFRIADGQIAEHWAELNALGLLAQIGAMPGA